jgi:Ca2+-binding RTX toxin-like protein
VAVINGTIGNDNLQGTSSDDIIYGYAGDDTLDGAAGNDALAGGTGNDTYVVNSSGDVVFEDLGEGTDTVNASISYVLGLNVENLALTGAAAINGTGNDWNNTITGNSANNVLDGGRGSDTLVGGLGDDTYVVEAIGDVVIENLSEGTDTVKASISYTLGANVENLVLTGNASTGTGNALNNSITGNDSSNVIDGGAGNDIMAGGRGSDIYYVDSVGDIIIEEAASGGGGAIFPSTDYVFASVSYTLSANVEILTLTGSAAINGTGNTQNNQITGNNGNNVLDGGAGADLMQGGLGDDTYIVDNAKDIVRENANAGTDTVNASVSFTLGTNVENLVLTGTATINGTGNVLNNSITGNSGNNTLDGGDGNDVLDGGAGDDILLGGNGEDTVIGGSGSDTLYGFNGNDTLNGDLGNDVLRGGIGSDTINGGDGDDRLIGGSYDFTVYSEWLSWTSNQNEDAAGIDVMAGGIGNDVYMVDAAADVVSESVNAGTDTVYAVISYTLGANLENLTLIAGTNGTGNELGNEIRGTYGNNTIRGEGGNDVLYGLSGNDILDGGAGNDVLNGGSVIAAADDDVLSGGDGADVFVFTQDLSGAQPWGFGQDRVTDFWAGAGATDVIKITCGTAFDSFAEVMAATSQVNSDTVINLGSFGTITLANVTVASLAADDFLFA